MNASTFYMKTRLIGMSFLQFGVWGAYLISMGTYLFSAGMGDKITWDFAMKCPKCNSMVGISFERAVPRLQYRRTDHTAVVKAYALPMPYHEVILSEPVGS